MTRRDISLIADRVISTYRNHGPGGLVERARLRVRHAHPQAYQEKVAGAFTARCRQLDRVIPADAASALDIGCNLGDLTAYCARRGLLAIGIERAQELVVSAQKRHAGTASCGFVLMDLGPDNVGHLPSFDVVLVLSVHHHWMRAHGPETTRGMLRTLAEKTSRVMVFEAPARKVRYGDQAPDFVDNDEQSVTGYIKSYLHAELGDLFGSIEPLGKAPGVGRREPYRWSYALHRERVAAPGSRGGNLSPVVGDPRAPAPTRVAGGVPTRADSPSS